LLTKILEELGFGVESNRVRDFSKRYRDLLGDLDSAYTMSRYGVFVYSKDDVIKMAVACKDLHKLLEEVENSVVG